MRNRDVQSVSSHEGAAIALYKYKQYLTESDSSAFDTRYAPGSQTENPGIYRCTSCGDEIAIAKGRSLPPQNHHRHTTNAKIEWQLVVFAQQNR